MASLADDKRDLGLWVHAFAIISVIGIAFGYWFACKQIQAVSADASLSTYPKAHLVLTMLRCYCSVIVFLAVSHCALTLVAHSRIHLWQTALSFLPLTLVYANCPLRVIALLILSIQGLCIFVASRQGDCRNFFSRYAWDIGALSVILAFHFFITAGLSPLHWNNPLLVADGSVSEEIPVLTPLFKEYQWVKMFSFSALDYSEWAGIPNPPITLGSPLLQLLTFILDLPSISVEHFHAVLLAIEFLLVVLGSFGFYLLLKYVFRIHGLLGLLGGCIYFSTASVVVAQWKDGGIFLSSYALFPYSILLLALAFRKADKLLACSAGAALATPFFFYAPHPEGTIYAVLLYGLFALGLMLFTRDLSWRVKFTLAALSFASFLILCCFVVLPIIHDVLTGAMYSAAHSQDAFAGKLKDFKRHMILLVIFSLIGFLLQRWRKRLTPAYFSLLLFGWVLSVFLCLTTRVKFITAFVHAFHLGLNLQSSWRLGMFVSCAAIAIILIGLDGIIYGALYLLNNRSHNRWDKFGLLTFFRQRNRLFAGMLGIALVAGIFCGILTMRRIKDMELADNPHGCPYYITLQSLLAHYAPLAGDAANGHFLQERMTAFERDGLTQPTVVSQLYRDPYFDALRSLGIKTISSIQDATQIEMVARKTYQAIDGFYLDPRAYCSNPLYSFDLKNRKRRILRYNLAGLYDELPDSHSTILNSESKPDWGAGPVSGLLFNNQTTTTIGDISRNDVQNYCGRTNCCASFVSPPSSAIHRDIPTIFARSAHA
jgi:hypothetical protein